MKKIKYLFMLLIGVVIIATGCEKSSTAKTLVCSRSINQGTVSLELKYTVTYEGEYVQKINSVEKITSDDTSVIESYKDLLETTYASYTKVDHYTNNITVSGNTLTSTTDIDYSKIDTAKLIEIDSANSQLFNSDNKVELSTIKELYETMGTTCEEK